MNYEDFERLISAPIIAINKEIANAQSSKQSDELRWKLITIRATIGRTIRHTLNYPELAQQYLDKQAKAVCENMPTPSKQQSINDIFNKVYKREE